MMMFSRLARTRRTTIMSSKNVLSAANGGRSSTGGGGSSVVYHQDDDDDKLGFLKPYLAATNNNEKHGSVISSKPCFLLPSPRMFPTFFSTQTKAANNKNSDKEKKGNNQESESEEESTIEERMKIITIIYLIQALAFSYAPRKEEQISFEEFKKKLLEPGLVDHIVVISNKSVAKVYVRNSPRNQTTNSAVEVDCKYYLNIKIVDSFKKTLEEAQEALGIDTHDYVRVTYASEMDWDQEIGRHMILILLLAPPWYVHQNMRGGLGSRGFTEHVRFGLTWLVCMSVWFI